MRSKNHQNQALLGTFAALPLLLAVNSFAFTLGSSSNSHLKGWVRDTLTFEVNPSCGSISAATLNTAIDTAIALWNGVPTSGITLARGSTSATTPALAKGGGATDAGPVIVCDTAFGTTTGADPNSVAGDGGFSAGGDNHINYGFLLLNIQAGATANVENANPTTLAAIIAHEMGHVLGLGHSSDTSALMFFTLNRTQMTLSHDDVDGITYLYPRHELGGDGPLGCASVAVVNGGSPPAGGGPGAALSLSGMIAACWVSVQWAKRRRPALLAPA